MSASRSRSPSPIISSVTGFDIDELRVAELRRGHDRTNEVDPERIARSALTLTDRAEEARAADLYIVTVPTPVDGANWPDLTPLLAATELVAGLIERGRPTTIVYESTVYPGVTEEICGPLIERRRRPGARHRFLPRLFPRAGEPRRPRAWHREDRQGRRRRERGGHRPARPCLRQDDLGRHLQSAHRSRPPRRPR